MEKTKKPPIVYDRDTLYFFRYDPGSMIKPKISEEKKIINGVLLFPDIELKLHSPPPIEQLSKISYRIQSAFGSYGYTEEEDKVTPKILSNVITKLSINEQGIDINTGVAAKKTVFGGKLTDTQKKLNGFINKLSVKTIEKFTNEIAKLDLNPQDFEFFLTTLFKCILLNHTKTYIYANFIKYLCDCKLEIFKDIENDIIKFYDEKINSFSSEDLEKLHFASFEEQHEELNIAKILNFEAIHKFIGNLFILGIVSEDYVISRINSLLSDGTNISMCTGVEFIKQIFTSLRPDLTICMFKTLKSECEKKNLVFRTITLINLFVDTYYVDVVEAKTEILKLIYTINWNKNDDKSITKLKDIKAIDKITHTFVNELYEKIEGDGKKVGMNGSCLNTPILFEESVKKVEPVKKGELLKQFTNKKRRDRRGKNKGFRY